MMLWAFVSPELTVNLAVRQWIGARRLQRKFGGGCLSICIHVQHATQTMCKEGMKDVEWTITHGHFLQMGGFMLMDENKHLGVIDAWKVESLLAEGQIDFPRITKEEIDDHSSSDGLSKFLAICHSTWFIAQCIARKRQGLVITELELVALAFAVLNAFIYILWWDKPQNVQRTVPVYLRREAGPSITIPQLKSTSTFRPRMIWLLN